MKPLPFPIDNSCFRKACLLPVPLTSGTHSRTAAAGWMKVLLTDAAHQVSNFQHHVMNCCLFSLCFALGLVISNLYPLAT